MKNCEPKKLDNKLFTLQPFTTNNQKSLKRWLKYAGQVIMEKGTLKYGEKDLPPLFNFNIIVPGVSPLIESIIRLWRGNGYSYPYHRGGCGKRVLRLKNNMQGFQLVYQDPCNPKST